MKQSLRGKLIFSYLAVALIVVVVVSAVIRLTSGQSLMSLVVEQQTAALKEAAVTYYESTSSLDEFYGYYLQSYQAQPRFEPPPDQPAGLEKPPDGRDIRGVTGLVDPEFRALIPMKGIDIGEVVPPERIQDEIAVEVNGRTIAWIIPDNRFEFMLSPEEQLFLRRTSLAIGLAALAGVALAVGMGAFLAHKLIKPIHRLTEASQALAKGQLEQQVPVTSRDELGQLTSTFNQMSTDLARADQQRKRMTADITHDLSTPLQIISGYMEMVEGGDVELTQDRIEIIKTEIDHLRRLVGDLTTLSQVEAGGLEMQTRAIDVNALLAKVFETYQPIAAKQGVALSLEPSSADAHILADEGRMMQVLKNLVENALRYTPAGGWINLGLVVAVDEKIQLVVSDSGSGIEKEDLPYVFERFYRADKARGGNSGKMGLGLAICKALVEAQGGKITAESAGKDQGTRMVISMDAAPD